MLSSLILTTLPSILLLLTVSSPTPTLANTGTNSYRYKDGDHVVQDGTVTLVGFEGSIFHVINYIPVCGSFSNSKRYTWQIDLSEKCTHAMSSYNTTSATSGIFDMLGIEIEDPPEQVVGMGEMEVCICGSFSQGEGMSADMCYWVDSSGFTESWWSLHTEERTASSFQRSSQQKALPSCNEVDLKKLLAESEAGRVELEDLPADEKDTDSDDETSGGSGSGSGSSTSATTRSSAKSTSTSSSSGSGEAPPPQEEKGLADTAKIWAPIVAAVCSIIFGATGLWYKRKESRKRKEKDARADSKI